MPFQPPVLLLVKTLVIEQIGLYSVLLPFINWMLLSENKLNRWCTVGDRVVISTYKQRGWSVKRPPFLGEKRRKKRWAKRADHPSTRFARPFFFLLYPVFCLFPNAEPGPRLSPTIPSADRRKLEQYLPCTMYTALYTDLSKNFFWPHFITLYSYFIVSGKHQFGKILLNNHIHIRVHVKSKLWDFLFRSFPRHNTT